MSENKINWKDLGILYVSNIIIFCYKITIIWLFYNEVITDVINIICLPRIHWYEVFFLLILFDMIVSYNTYIKYLQYEFLVEYHKTESDIKDEDIRVVHPIILKALAYTIMLLLTLWFMLFF